MVDKDREMGKRGTDKEREIEAIRVRTNKEKGAGHTEFKSEAPGMGLGQGHERRQERREDRREGRQEDRQENRQERREERRDNR